jgi:CspA family cold shock protein
MARETGRITYFNVGKGFGFIQPDLGGKDVFVHAKALELARIDESLIDEGTRLEFEQQPNNRDGRMQASQLRLLP